MATNGKNENRNEKTENGTHETEPSKLEQQIVQQIEYYFGDINLPKDKFMLEKIKLDDGWIPMSLMMNFQRLSKLTTDPKVVAKALTHSDLMEVDESGEEIKIRRSPEFPLPVFDEARRKDLLERSIYCCRFPADTEMDTLLNFFNPYGPIDNVLMRKYKDKLSKTFKFKGSVFVTFKAKEKGQEFLDLASVKYNDQELTRKWKADYLAEKKQEFVDNKLKRKKKDEDEKEEDEEDVNVKEKLPRGATIHLTGEFEGITRESIRDKFMSLGYEPAYIEFKMGETEAYVRLGEEDSGKRFVEKVGAEIEISNSKLTARLLGGEEEETFLKAAAAVRSAALKRRQQLKKSGRKGRGAKGGKGGRKRKGNVDVDDSPPAKKAVTA